MHDIRVTVIGKEYLLPEGSTVLEALETAGYRMEHGGGCGVGVCGACAVLYRMEGEMAVKATLACRTPIAEGMNVLTLPHPTVEGGRADPTMMEREKVSLARVFPSLASCMECRACDRVCPQGIRVSRYIRDARMGRIRECAEATFACVMCGLCETQCRMKIPQPAVAMLARRIQGVTDLEGDKTLPAKVLEIREGAYDAAMTELLAADEETLRQRYEARQFEGTEG